jgi:hypothetical protein
MRRISIVIAVCFALAVGMSLIGQGRDLDAIMKEVGPLWQGVQGGAPGLQAAINNPMPDYAKIAADAGKLQGLFSEAEAQFTKMKMAEPAGIAKSAAEASGALAKEAKAGKIADAKASTTSIGQCKACHAKYRESDGAGGFKLKMQ